MSAWLFLGACCVLAYGGFCRLVRADTTTLFCIRVVIWAMTVAAFVCIAAVLVWGYSPGWPSAVLSASFSAVQVATSVLWRNGVPDDYRDPRVP
jgi:hypothetical protein